MVSPPTTKYQVRYLQQRVVLTEATGDAELVVWDGREFGHWCAFNISLTMANYFLEPLCLSVS